MPIRSLWKHKWRICSGVMVAVSAASASAYAHRPQATMLKRSLERDNTVPACVSTWHEPVTTVMDSGCSFCDALSTSFRYVDGAFYRLGQAITLGLTGGFALFWFKTGWFAKFTCDGRENLIDAINLARKEGRVIITYANHRSTIDDPGIMPCLVPPHWLIHPPYMRWGLCAEDVCFGVNEFASTYFGAGKALPVCRGGGIGQAEMRMLESKFAPGCWIHIFPEGKVDQVTLRQDNPPPTLPFRWGIGRVVAAAAAAGWDPIVLPLYIHGTEGVYPQDDNNQLYTWKPQQGARVHVVVGDAVDGSTLLAEVSQSVVRAPKDAALWNHGDACLKTTPDNVAIGQLKEKLQQQQQPEQPQPLKQQEKDHESSSRNWMSWLLGRSSDRSPVTSSGGSGGGGGGAAAAAAGVPSSSTLSPPLPVEITISPAERNKTLSLADPLNWSCYCGSSVKSPQAAGGVPPGGAVCNHFACRRLSHAQNELQLYSAITGGLQKRLDLLAARPWDK